MLNFINIEFNVFYALVKIQNFGKDSKIKILVKIKNLGQNFGKKSKDLSKIKILVKIQNFC